MRKSFYECLKMAVDAAKAKTLTIMGQGITDHRVLKEDFLFNDKVEMVDPQTMFDPQSTAPDFFEDKEHSEEEELKESEK